MNIPNALSIFRLVLVPVFVAVFFGGGENARYIAVAVYALAAFTDILDGYIARRYQLITRLGRILDPLADKLMAIAVLISITIAGVVPVWAIVIFFAKEALMGAGALFMYKRTDDVMPSDYLGKGATVVFFLICVILILFKDIPPLAATVMISCALALTIAAFIHYLIKFNRLVSRKG